MPSSQDSARRPPEHFATAIRDGDRPSLARAITLVESRRPDDLEYGYEILRRLMADTGQAHRIAISGPPGVGKSTLIEALGLLLVEQGHRVAVLAVDPSSSMSGGSILGDKSRMSRLAQETNAFIRPSPTDLRLGGVGRRTREAMYFCEAAGFDRILIETVGVGQSEIRVASMVDTFVLLVQPGAGDELQGIKKGIVELADLLVVTKMDGDSVGRARDAAAEYSAALRYLTPRSTSWRPPVLSTSARNGDGMAELVAALAEHRDALTAEGALEPRRSNDLADWLYELTEEAVLRRALDPATVRRRAAAGAVEVADGTESAYRRALELAAPATGSPAFEGGDGDG